MRFRTFREALLNARNEREVTLILKEAIGNLTPDELKALPEECRTVLVDRRTDLHAAAVTMLQCDLRHRGERDIGDLTRQIAELYAWACVRLSQLEHTGPSIST
jgi:cation transport regulator ChaB